MFSPFKIETEGNSRFHFCQDKTTYQVYRILSPPSMTALAKFLDFF